MNKSHHWKESARKTNPFDLPEGYFESFEGRVMERIKIVEAEEKPAGQQRRLLYWISGVAAAALIGLVGVQQFVLKPTRDVENQEMMYAVVEYFAQDLDDLSFASLMADNNVLSETTESTDNDLLDYMDIDDLTLLEALLNGE